MKLGDLVLNGMAFSDCGGRYLFTRTEEAYMANFTIFREVHASRTSLPSPDRDPSC